MDFYANRVLRVDLSCGDVRVDPLDPAWLSLYIGGKGLLFRYLYDEVDPGLDAWSPRNPLVVATGPFAGTCVPTTSRTVLGCKSPATGGILDSYMGGSFGATLKQAGYDILVVTGAADQPTVIEISDDKVGLRLADDLWGLCTSDVEDRLRDGLGAGTSVLSIGPAGESLVPWACVSNDRSHKAGRGGSGAIMGAKNLKAVAVRGTGAVTVGDARAFGREVLALNASNIFIEDYAWTYEEGTPCLVELINAGGALPTRNFSSGQFALADAIGSEALQRVRVRKRACYQCTIACRNVHSVGDLVGEGPEFETLALCGSNCGIGDLEAIIRFNADCDEYGLDTMSTGVVTALAMDLAERDVVDLGLRFGDVDAYSRVPRLIASRSGVGAELALGARSLARRYGHPELAMEVKNLEMPAYDPRACFGMSLSYATSDRGACHRRAYTAMEEILMGALPPDSLEGKAALSIAKQDYCSLRNTGVFCDFAYDDIKHIAALMRHVWRRDVGTEELIRAGERIWNLARVFNIREGLGRADDAVPSRLLTEALPDGPMAGRIIGDDAFDDALQEYYALRGWDATGTPTPAKLHELGLDADLSPADRGAACVS